MWIVCAGSWQEIMYISIRNMNDNQYELGSSMKEVLDILEYNV